MTFNYLISIFALTGWLFFINVPAVFAGYQSCTSGESCTVGEFLFDDSYQPITSATCTITSRKPDETLHLNAAAMTSSTQNDGWYSYTFDTTSLTLGTYRAKVCCTSGTDYLCLDKTFTINNPSLDSTDIENAVLDAQTSDHDTTGTIGEALGDAAAGSSLTPSEIWDYNNRTLTSFGTLPADIWNYSSRSLSSFGDLISNLWGHNTRTLTGTGDLATKTDIENLGTTTVTNTNLITLNTELAEQRNLLELLVNKPVIETSIEESFNLESKLEKTNEVTKDLADLTNDLNPNNLTQMLTLIGSPTDESAESIYTNINWLTKAWDNQLTKDLKTKIDHLHTLTTELKSRSDFYGTNSPGQLDAITTTNKELTSLIGNPNDNASKTSLYGYTKYLANLNQNLKAQEKQLNTLVTDWHKADPTSLDRTLSQIRDDLYSLNLIPQSQVLGASTNDDPTVTRRNQFFNLKGLIQTSRIILSQFAGQSVQHIWLEEGSIIFKAVVTNPSTLVSQTVPLKFSLPSEVKQENIIKIADGLTINFDPEKDSYYVSGEFNLAPGETRTFEIEVNDVWQIDLDLIESYRTQAEQLLDPLRNTAYYGQGATVKADIDVTLNKIIADQQTFRTPEERIRAHREAQLELNGVEQKLAVLQELVANASSAGSIFGFIGGVQAVAVWGLIIIVITGFVYLSLYMRALTMQLNRAQPRATRDLKSPTLLELLGQLFKKPGTTSHRIASFIFFALLSASVSALIGSIVVKSNLATAPTSQNPPEAINKPNQATKIATETVTETKVLGITSQPIAYFIVKVSPNKPTNLYSANNEDSTLLIRLKESQVVARQKEEGEWSQVEFLDDQELKTGWIKTNLLIPEPTN